MGYGQYSFSDREYRTQKLGYKSKSAKEIFKSRFINKEMNPKDVNLRESRDSDEHPNSIPIIIGLDVTGSMGTVPHHLVKEGLPNIISKLMENGINDPQILFTAIGDHKHDKAPLQIGQFESSDDLMDKWLTNVYLEGGGGRNGGESYLLAWYFAYNHTVTDSIEKRNKKGYLITIGDEPTFLTIPYKNIENIMGKRKEIVYNEIWNDNNEWGIVEEESTIDDNKDYDGLELLKKAQEKYNVYHIHVAQTKSGKLESTIEGWHELLGDNLIVAETREDVANIIADIIVKNENLEIEDNFI